MSENFTSDSLHDPRGMMPVYAVQEFVDRHHATFTFDVDKATARFEQNPDDDAKHDLAKAQTQLLCLVTTLRMLTREGVPVSVNRTVEELPAITEEIDKKFMLELLRTFAQVFNDKEKECVVMSLQTDISPDEVIRNKAILEGIREYLIVLLQMLSEYDDHFAQNPDVIKIITKNG